ncbi:MAG TPA: isopentenyl phosphate kinase [Candidatus Thermoplasmatota archaeon]|nr:isopentenyl phosphate kinase [Candidatus Thermoplasmatota archaeon]
MASPVLVKLGGALLTDKAREMALRGEVAKRLVGEVAQARRPVVLLHGAGSFGHPFVKRFGLGMPPFDDAKRTGVSQALAGVACLAAEVLGLAQEAGLRTVPVPLHLEQPRRGALPRAVAATVADLLAEGFTPVLHGTLVRDGELGWRVLSADEALAALASRLKPAACVFATDVDGVHARDPKQFPDAPLLPAVRADTVLGAAGAGGAGTDTTGRMAGKLEHARAAARHAPTLVVNGLAPGRLLAAIQGRPVVGTRVE